MHSCMVNGSELTREVSGKNFLKLSYVEFCINVIKGIISLKVWKICQSDQIQNLFLITCLQESRFEFESNSGKD